MNTQPHAHFFRACGSRSDEIQSSVWIAAFLCASLKNKSSHRSHAMFSTLRDPPFTAPTQSTRLPLSLLFPSSWTPTATLLFGRFVEQSPLTGYPIEVSSASRRDCLESSCDDLATSLVVSEAGERSDVGRLASPLILQERETSANEFGIYHPNTEKFKSILLSHACLHRETDSEK